jgi:methionine aminotransferase
MSNLANEYGAINLSQGFPGFDCDQKLKDLVGHYVSAGKNQYAPMAGAQALNQAIASKINQSYGLTLNPSDHITITAGATQAIFTALGAIVQPGDEIICLDPAYDSYRPTIKAFGGKPISYKLRKPDYSVDWGEIESLCTSKTKAIIINSPHNPTGKIFSEEDLSSLQDLVLSKDLFLLSDEVYEHIVFDDQKHHSVLSYPELFKRSFVVYSFGKTFHVTGWKIGYCVAPIELTREFRKIHQFNVFSVNHPIQLAIAQYLENPENYLSLPKFFQQKRDTFENAMSASRFKAINCSGTYFQLFDYSEISDESDRSFSERITKDFGVASIPISVFYADGYDDKVVRFCFAKNEDVLLEAAKKLARI